MDEKTKPTLGELSHQIDGLSHQINDVKQALSDFDYIKDKPLTDDNGSRYVFELLWQVIKNLGMVSKSLSKGAMPAKNNTT